MSAEFELEILTLGKKLFGEKVSEAIIPAWDGETGILANHENFVGKLGTGSLKIVQEGKDFWYMVSGGVYEVRDGVVSVLAQVAEEASQVDMESAKEIDEKLSSELPKTNLNTIAGQNMTMELERARARLEVYNRTKSVH